MTAEDYDAMEARLSENYKSLIDSLPIVIDQIDYNIQEARALENNAEAIFLCYAMEWVATDLYNSAKKENRWKYMLMFSKYTKMRKDILMVYPLSRKDELIKIVKKAKEYYSQSAARKKIVHQSK